MVLRTILKGQWEQLQDLLKCEELLTSKLLTLWLDGPPITQVLQTPLADQDIHLTDSGLRTFMGAKFLY